jgi:hypothetical protein
MPGSPNHIPQSRTLAKCQAAPKPELLDLILRAFIGPMLGAVTKKVSTCQAKKTSTKEKDAFVNLLFFYAGA